MSNSTTTLLDECTLCVHNGKSASTDRGVYIFGLTYNIFDVVGFEDLQDIMAFFYSLESAVAHAGSAKHSLDSRPGHYD